MLVEAKSNLAKLMASENLFVEQKNVETAYFDLKSRILTIPILNGNFSAELYDLLLGHEVGHALETPEKGWHDSIIDLGVNKSILNVCEDSRIEKKIKRKFPGIRISFIKGYKELMEMDFFGLKDRDLKKLNFIDRINLHCKCGATLGIKFSKKELKLLNEVETTETFEEVVAVARKIQDLMKADLDKKTQKAKSGQGEDDVENGGEGQKGKKLTIIVQEGGKSEAGGKSEEINLEDYDEVEVVKVDAPNDEETADEDSDESEETSSSGVDAGKLGYTESETDKSFRERERELFNENVGKDITYTNIPELKLDNVIVTYKDLYSAIFESNKRDSSYIPVKYNMAQMKENYNKFRLESNKVVSYLVKEFEMRKNAEQQARVQVSKTGELNMSKLHDYKFNDDIFKRMSKVPNGKSHGLVMYIDWSGSMGEHINSTVKQLLNLSMFCRKVNIPFEVYAFSSYNKTTFDYPTQWKHKQKYEVQVPKIGDLVSGDFTLLNLLSSKMNNKEFTEAASLLLDYGTSGSITKYCTNYLPPEFFTLGGTPLNEAIISAFQMIPKFKEQNRLEIVNAVFLTDGEGSMLYNRYGRYSNTGKIIEENGVMPNARTRSFVRDTKTRATVELDASIGRCSFGSMQTVALLKLLKQRLECNLIGFYVCSARDARSAMESFSRKIKIDQSVDEFRKNGSVMIKEGGYDEYYFLKSSSLDTDDIEFEGSSTTRGLVNSFSRYTGNKIKSRVVLNRFINLIT